MASLAGRMRMTMPKMAFAAVPVPEQSEMTASDAQTRSALTVVEGRHF